MKGQSFVSLSIINLDLRYHSFLSLFCRHSLRLKHDKSKHNKDLRLKTVSIWIIYNNDKKQNCVDILLFLILLLIFL